MSLWQLMTDRARFNVRDAVCAKTAGEASGLMFMLRGRRGEDFAVFVYNLSNSIGKDMSCLRLEEGGAAAMKKNVMLALQALQ